MKSSYRRLVALALFMLALNIAALAQDFRPKVRAEIPFRVSAGGNVLPAGNYTLAISSESHNVAIFQSNGIGTFLLGSPNDGSSNGRALLTFRLNNEDVYVLQKIQAPDVGVSFDSGKISTRLVENQSAETTKVILASLVR